MTEHMHKEYARLRRRPFLAPVWLSVAGVVLLLLLALWGLLSASTTTIYVMRHAETLADAGPDPALSLAGRLRAERLRDFFGQAPAGYRLDAVIVSPARRDAETAQPLAGALGVPVVVVPANDPSVAVRRVLSGFQGGRVLVIGSDTTVTAVVRGLSGQVLPAPLPDDFGTLYVVARPRYSPAAVSVLHLP